MPQHDGEQTSLFEKIVESMLSKLVGTQEWDADSIEALRQLLSQESVPTPENLLTILGNGETGRGS